MSAKNISWENFRSTVMVSGQQRVHRIKDVPLIEMFYDGADDRIGLLVEIQSDVSIPLALTRLASVRSRLHASDGRWLLEVSTAASSLHRHFYHFAVAVAERITLEAQAATDAVALELQSFTDLFEQKEILGIERQLGLLGELLFLERVLLVRGISAFDAWIGPHGEPHDFRLQQREFEVKCASAARRTHIIHGIDQLVPSSGFSLFLVSILVGPAGADLGFSLIDKITQLMQVVAGDVARSAAFANALQAFGYRNQDAQFYTRRFVSRRPMAVVAVDGSFPAITRSMIHAALALGATRVGAVQYEVNVDGIENEDGSKPFVEAIGS